MKYLKITLILLVFTIVAGCERLSLETLDGQARPWSDYRGEWVMVNYWAEWCEPCREEIPELNDLNRDSNVTVLGVNYDGKTGQSLAEAADAMGIRFPVVTPDPGAKLGWKAPVGMPATYVVGPDGELVETRFGAQSASELRAVIQAR